MSYNQPEDYDLYVTNIQRVNNDFYQTKVKFEKFLNYFLIENRLDELYGIVSTIKFPNRSRDHTGNTYQAFVRLEKPHNHEAAALALDGAPFRGRPITVKLNDIPAELAQWQPGNGEWYHGEKLKYVRNLTARTETEDKSSCEYLQNQVYDLEKQVNSLKLSEAEKTAKIKNQEKMLETISDENNRLTGYIFKLSEESFEKSRLLQDAKNQIAHLKSTSEVARLQKVVKEQKRQISNLEQNLKKEVQYKTTTRVINNPDIAKYFD